MPTYDYLCESCEKTFTKRHSYKEKVLDCPLCDSKGSVVKLLISPVKVKGLKNLINKRKIPGTEVKEHIKNAKLDLEAEKDRLKKRSQ